MSTLRVNSVSNLSGNDLTVPPGAVQFFARNTAPNGWVKANGAALSRSTYADLFTAIGTTFGAGNGSTTFTLPDMRGEFPRGWDDARGADSSRSFGSAQGDAIRNITGQVIDFTYNQSYTEPGSANGAFFNSGSVPLASPTTAQQGGYPDRVSFDASRQVPTASENRPRNIALLACIKY